MTASYNWYQMAYSQTALLTCFLKAKPFRCLALMGFGLILFRKLSVIWVRTSPSNKVFTFCDHKIQETAPSMTCCC